MFLPRQPKSGITTTQSEDLKTVHVCCILYLTLVIAVQAGTRWIDSK